MIPSFVPAPLATGRLGDDLWVVRDGFVNLYVLRGPRGLVCVDAGWRPRVVRKAFGELGLDPDAVVAVLLTHTHWDHAWGAEAFPAAKRPTAETLSSLEAPDCAVSALAGLRLRAIPCPGHTADSVAYMTEDGGLFTGDTVWLRGGVAMPHPYLLNRNNASLRASLGRLARLEGLGSLYTGHTGSVQLAATALHPWLMDPERP